MSDKEKISPFTVERLSLYIRKLRDFVAEGEVVVSSADIAERAGCSATQVRKDLSFFGSFGKKGYGYDIDELFGHLEGILGLNKRWKVALIGLGKLGQSLVQSRGFRKSGFEIVAIFEKDPDKIGRSFSDIEIYPVEKLLEVCEKETILLAVVAVPPEAANEVFQLALDAGIRGILNLSGQKGFKPPIHAVIKDIDIPAEMESLSYFVTNF